MSSWKITKKDAGQLLVTDSTISGYVFGLGFILIAILFGLIRHEFTPVIPMSVLFSMVGFGILAIILPTKIKLEINKPLNSISITTGNILYTDKNVVLLSDIQSVQIFSRSRNNNTLYYLILNKHDGTMIMVNETRPTSPLRISIHGVNISQKSPVFDAALTIATFLNVPYISDNRHIEAKDVLNKIGDSIYKAAIDAQKNHLSQDGIDGIKK